MRLHKLLILCLFLEISLFKSAISAKTDARKREIGSNFFARVRHRVKSLTFPESQVAEKLRRDAMKESWDVHYKEGRTEKKLFTSYQSNLYESNLFKMLAVMTRAENILDVGMFTGLSAAAFLDSPHVKQVISIESEPFLFDWVSSRMNLYRDKNPVHKIMIGNSTESLKELAQAGSKFDLVYLDLTGDEDKKHIEEYEFIMMKEMISKDGVIIIHSIKKNEEFCYPKARNGKGTKILSYVKEDQRVDQVFIVDPSRSQKQLSGYLIVFPKTSKEFPE